MIACGYPVTIIKDDKKQQYYQLLGDIQVYDGIPDLFYIFIGERILESQKLILETLEGKDIEEPDDLEKRVAMLNSILHGLGEEVQKTKDEPLAANPFLRLLNHNQTNCSRYGFLVN